MITRLVRCLDAGDAVAAGRLLDEDPVQNVYLRSELRQGGLRSGTWWAVEQGSERGPGRFTSLMVGGGLVVPWLGDLADAPTLAGVLDQHRQPQSITGPRQHVHALNSARRVRVRPRESRDPQPVMVIEKGQLTADGAPEVRRSAAGDLEPLVVAAAHMHREEMGVDPLAVDPAGWRFRMASLVDRGWSFTWMERGRVVFKAELSAWTPDVCQVQGVWVAPALRGRGVGRRGMAAVCTELFREVPRVSLYVNHFNAVALGLYAGLGFVAVAEFATLFF